MPATPDNWVDLVLQLADRSQPDWVALEHGDRRMTIGELATAMRRAGSCLAGEGVVAISSADPILHTVGVLGAVCAGRTAMLVDHAHPDAVFADAVARAGATATVGRAVPGVTALDLDDLAAGAPSNPIPRSPAAIGSILLTSGSTGAPKLVLRSRGADLHAAMALRIGAFPIGAGDRFWLCVTHAGAPFLTLVMGSLLARATVVFGAFDRRRTGAFMAEHAITCVYLVPTMLRLAREQDRLEGPGWDGLRALQTGGERLDAATERVLLGQFAGRVSCAYGATEIQNLTAATSAEMAAHTGTVGRANPLRMVRIVAPGTREPLPAGAEGEVLVCGGAGMFSGYLGEDPPADGWYPTGDLGHLDGDGYLHITGRGSSVVQVGGNRVSTEEVAAILREHADVAQAAVIAVDDPMWTNRLEAFVVARAGCAPDGAQLRSWLGERLPPHKLPRGVRLLDELPLDASGKLALRALHAEAEAGAAPG